jgi:5-methylcytosine-specific restriction endonuclease McrA
MEVFCVNCGIKFIKPKAWTKKVKNNFCSKRCFGEWWKINKPKKETTKLKLNCDNCGKDIYKYIAWAKRVKHNFCSKECCNAWKIGKYAGVDSPKYRRKTVLCDYCRKSIIKKSYLVKDNKKCFCNNVCYGNWLTENNIGINASNWRGGINSINDNIRKSKKYKEYRIKIFERDNYTCQKCGKHGGPLHAHHIKSFSLYPNLRFDIKNGVTLCEYCHKQTDTYLKGKDKINKEA